MRRVSSFFMLFAACAPENAVRVREVTELPAITTAGVTGRDGGASVVIDGVSAWIFGDSFLRNADADGARLHSSSYFTTTDEDGNDGLQDLIEPTDERGVPLSFLDQTDGERSFTLAHLPASDGTCAANDAFPCGSRFATWPGTSVINDDGDALVFYTLLLTQPGDAFSFESVGQSIALWQGVDERPQRPTLSSGAHPTMLFQADEPPFGIAAIVDDDGVMYAFGCESGFLVSRCKLGRVPVGAALERAAWEFYDGNAYVSDVARAAVVVDGAPIMTLVKNAHLDRFLLLYSGVVSNEVRARTADQIEGPWSDEVVVFIADHGDDDTTYDAYLHPELDDSGASLFVSHTRNLQGAFVSETALLRVDLE